MVFKESLKKYGLSALWDHGCLSIASFTGFYVAVKKKADVESFLNKFNLPTPWQSTNPDGHSTGDNLRAVDLVLRPRDWTIELASSTGGALAVTWLYHAALAPVRVPITLALTHPVARLLIKRRFV